MSGARTSTDAPREIAPPDRRLRVFISSTLEELAAERAAVKAAVTGLRLTPVMFELGARAHPPRELYRAYLEQSDVFVGIYGERYGWVAPDMTISGLEDEYELSAGKPRLLYVRRSAPAREPRLAGLITRIQAESGASTTPYDNSGELAERVAGDTSAARGRLVEAAGLHRSIGDQEGMAYCLDGLAGLLLLTGDARAAARLSGAADATRTSIGVAVWPMLQSLVTTLADRVRAALGTEEDRRERAAGAHMGPWAALDAGLGAVRARP